MLPRQLGPRFALEALFLILLAIGAGLADLSSTAIVLVMLVAWVLVALLEFTSDRLAQSFPPLRRYHVPPAVTPPQVEQPAELPPAAEPPPEAATVIVAPPPQPPEKVELPAPEPVAEEQAPVEEEPEVVEPEVVVAAEVLPLEEPERERVGFWQRFRGRFAHDGDAAVTVVVAPPPDPPEKVELPAAEAALEDEAPVTPREPGPEVVEVVAEVVPLEEPEEAEEPKPGVWRRHVRLLSRRFEPEAEQPAEPEPESEPQPERRSFWELLKPRRVSEDEGEQEAQEPPAPPRHVRLLPRKPGASRAEQEVAEIFDANGDEEERQHG